MSFSNFIVCDIKCRVNNFLEDFSMASLGERIKELRVSKELTQSDIAKLLNITTRQEQRYESDKSDMPISKAVTLADFFDVSLDYLVGRSDDPTRK